MLQKGKTPSDIFENVNIDNVTRCYAAEYLGLAEYNFSCHVQIVSKNEAEDFHSGNPSPDFYTSHDSIYAAKPANIGELALVHEKFFPEEYKLKELLSNGDLLPELELGIEAVAFCSANTNYVEQCNIYNKAYDQAEKAIMKYYENFWFQHSNIEIEFTDTQYYSVLIPVWKIDYSYSGQHFTCFVNGHSNSSTAILGHNNTYCSSFPEDGEKVKGLFGKLKVANDNVTLKDGILGTINKVKTSQIVQSVKNDIDSSESIGIIKKNVKSTAEKVKNSSTYEKVKTGVQSTAAKIIECTTNEPAQNTTVVINSQQPGRPNTSNNNETNQTSLIDTQLGGVALSQFMFREQVWWRNLLLSIVTAGSYKVFMWYREYIEVRVIESRSQVKKKIPFILLLLLFYATGTLAGFVFMVMYYKKLINVSKQCGLHLKPKNAYIYSLMMYIRFYSFYLNVKNHNAVTKAYKNNAEMIDSFDPNLDNRIANQGVDEIEQTIDDVTIAVLNGDIPVDE